MCTLFDRAKSKKIIVLASVGTSFCFWNPALPLFRRLVQRNKRYFQSSNQRKSKTLIELFEVCSQTEDKKSRILPHEYWIRLPGLERQRHSLSFDRGSLRVQPSRITKNTDDLRFKRLSCPAKSSRVSRKLDKSSQPSNRLVKNVWGKLKPWNQRKINRSCDSRKTQCEALQPETTKENQRNVICWVCLKMLKQNLLRLMMNINAQAVPNKNSFCLLQKRRRKKCLKAIEGILRKNAGIQLGLETKFGQQTEFTYLLQPLKTSDEQPWCVLTEQDH